MDKLNGVDKNLEFDEELVSMTFDCVPAHPTLSIRP